MSNEENFKQQLQDLADSLDLPFSEADWASASAYIEARRRKRRRAAWMFFLAGALILGSLTVFLLPRTMAEKGFIANEETGAATPALDRVASPAVSALPSLTPADPDPPVSGGPERTENSETLPAPAQPQQTQKHPDRFAAETKAPVKTKMEAPKTASFVASPMRDSSALSGPELKQNPIAESREEQPVASKEELLPEIKAASEEEPAVVGDTTATPATVAEAPASASVEPVPPAIQDSSKQANSVAPASDFKEILLSLEGGVSWNTGWGRDELKEAGGFNPVFGIQYYNYLSHKLAMSFGAQYNRVGGFGASSFTSRTTRFGLGEESAVTVITPLTVHYFSVPLRLNYALDERNSFGIGYTIAYLLNVEARVEKYNMVRGARENQQQYVTAGYTEGFSIFDSQFSVFYKRSIYKQVSLRAEAFYGISDIKENTFFNSVQFERNAGLRLSLVYDIKRR